MLKVVYCITKKPGMTDDEFFCYWKDVHGPIGARIPGLRRLVQSHRCTVPGDENKPDYDGIAELWFDDAHSLLAARPACANYSIADKEKAAQTSPSYLVDEGCVK